MLIDALAFVPLLMEWFFAGHPLVRLTRLVRFLKIARYSPALATIGRVIAAERRSLLACVVIITGVLLAAAATMLAVEGHVQPERLGDMPKAMWWAAAMLAKIGGAEISPLTAPGRIVAAITVMLGIFCFALPVAIIGRGFYEEIRRRDFIVTFAMVARVPLFAHLDVAADPIFGGGTRDLPHRERVAGAPVLARDPGHDGAEGDRRHLSGCYVSTRSHGIVAPVAR